MNTDIKVNLASDESISIVKKGTSKKPPFVMLGKGITTKYMLVDSVNWEDVLMDMNSAEAFAYRVIRDFRQRTMDKYYEYSIYIAIKQNELTDYQKKKFKVGAASLIKKKVLVRVKRGVYMLHPSAILGGNYREHEQLWMLYNEL